MGFWTNPKQKLQNWSRIKWNMESFGLFFNSMMPQWCHKGLMVKSRENWCTLVLITINHSFICIYSNYAGFVVTIFFLLVIFFGAFSPGRSLIAHSTTSRKFTSKQSFLNFSDSVMSSITSQFGANWILLAALVFNSRRHGLAVLACTPLLTSFNHDFIDPAFHVNIVKVT